MRIVRNVVVCAAAGLLGAGIAFAAGNPLDERVSLNLEKTSTKDTFDALGQMVGADVVQVDPGVTGTVTVTLQNVRVRTLLDAVCESIGCRWDLQDKKLRVTSTSAEKPARAFREALDSPIDLKVTNADSRELLKTFGQIMGIEVSLDSAITGKVSLELTSTPVRQALDAACFAVGCDWEVVDGSGKTTLKVTAKPKRAKG